jgi:Cft2 family RNA processing exonuclease
MWLLPIARKHGVPIWLDGSISKIWDIFKDNPWSDKDLPLPELGEKTGIMRIRDSMHREALLRKDGPVIFVTTPGMFDHRPMVKYLECGLTREDFSFIITSWFAPGTNADRLWSAWGKIQKARQSGNNEEFTVKIHDDEAGWQRLAFRACFHRFGLGAHGDLNDFTEFIEDIVKVCRGGKLFEFMVLGHGSHQSQQEAAQQLRQFSEQTFFSQDKLTINVG